MKYLTKNKYWDLVEDYNLDKMLYLLVDRPDNINKYNDFVWGTAKNNFIRGHDFPSVIYNTEKHIFWYYNNAHRRKNNKPIIIWAYGKKEYFIEKK